MSASNTNPEDANAGNVSLGTANAKEKKSVTSSKTDSVLPVVLPAPMWRATLFGFCPQCSTPTLFATVVGFADKCRKCGHDRSAYNVGDGPAALLTMLIGALLVSLALAIEVAFYPPFWVHVILWVPLTGASVVLGLRVAKAWLLHVEHRRNAAEGQLVAQRESLETPETPHDRN